MLIIAGTGHRPNKLGGYSEIVLNRLTDLSLVYFKKSQPDQIISGMALGWDTVIAQAAIELNIPLIAAVPFQGQESRWKASDQLRYQQILEQAEQVVIVSEGSYSAYKMQIRNQWMVDNCNRLLALYDDSEGGTANCVRYAQSKGVKIKNLWQSWEKYKGF